MTELIWNGKHDKKREARVAEDPTLPFRVLESIGPSESEGEEVQQDLFGKPKQDTEWRNLLIRGDNKVVMSSLRAQFAGRINLIYADPPFGTGRGFSLAVRVGDESSLDQPLIVEERAYRDTWGGGFDAYLQMLHGRLDLMWELLAEDGSIYVHVGPGIVHYVKALMDELFGQDCYRNEIIWKRDVAGKGAKRTSAQWPRNAEHILFYSKSPERWFFRQPYRELSEKQKRVYRYREPDGRQFKTVQLGDYSEESIGRMEREGLIYVSSTGKKYKKYYLDEARDTVDCLWTDILGFGTRTASAEHLGFPTQKPEALLERIIEASSRRGDLVADFFCGSGTTGAVAEKLGRRWILCDLSRHAVHVTRKRLLQIESRFPFHVLTLDGYERHKLAEKGFGAGGGERDFILRLYQAEPLSGFEMLHGRKGEACVHVGSPDGLVTLQEIRQSLEEARETGVGEVHFLGWEFETGFCERVREVEKESCVKLRLIPIPREALEVSDPAREKVRFFDLSDVELAHEVSGKTVTIAIKDFRSGNPENLPKKSRAKEWRFSDFIDYWAVDWDSHGGAFRNRWRAFRTRKKRKLTLECSHTYATAGTYGVTVKVVDVFANETKRLIKVEVS